jgi:hypothetical protein
MVSFSAAAYLTSELAVYVIGAPVNAPGVSAGFPIANMVFSSLPQMLLTYRDFCCAI